MSKLSVRSADGHLGLGATRLRGSRQSSPVACPCFQPPTLWASVLPVPSFEILGPYSFAWKGYCTELSAFFFAQILPRCAMQKYPHVSALQVAVNPSFQPRCKLTHFYYSPSILSGLGVGSGNQMPLFSDHKGCKWENHIETGTLQTVLLLYILFVYRHIRYVVLLTQVYLVCLKTMCVHGAMIVSGILMQS